MKGLLFKDAYTLMRQYWIFLVLMVLCGLPSRSCPLMAVIYSGLIPISVLSGDDQCGWTRLAGALPVSRKQVVLCKYALGGACTLASVLVALAVEGIAAGATGSPWGGDALLSGAIFLCIGLVMQSVSMPLMFKFGAEKGRMWLIVALAAAGGALGGLGTVAPQSAGWTDQSLLLLAALAAPLSLALSAWLSIKIFTAKDL